MHERVCENPHVVGVRRSRHSDVCAQRIVPENPGQGLSPPGRVHDGVVVDLVEVVATILVRLLYQCANYPGRRVLFCYVYFAGGRYSVTGRCEARSAGYRGMFSARNRDRTCASEKLILVNKNLPFKSRHEDLDEGTFHKKQRHNETNRPTDETRKLHRDDVHS